MVSLYLHIPFCLSKCHYCSFSSLAGAKDLYKPYVAALIAELESLAEKNSVVNNHSGLDTLFIGGGTPTCLPSALLQEILHASFELFDIVPEAEISVEANPGTVDRRYMETLLEAGVNRLSLGVQSFDSRELKVVGRVHDDQEAFLAINAAGDAGFENINLDLMSGLPGQTPLSWRKSLEKGLSFSPEHLSLYQLTVEPETPFYALVAANVLTLPGEDDVIEMDEITSELCRSAGLHQYETSNYAITGHECRHNINYWQNGEYLAAGTSAVSCLQGVRERRVADPKEYIRRIQQKESVVVEQESLGLEASFRETVIMGLRMVQGVSRRTLQERYAMDLLDYYGAALKKLLDLGFLELTETHLRMTPKGWPLANSIMADLV